jgi:hypothetical protein
MKLTKQTLKRIIKEELNVVLRESGAAPTSSIPSKYKSKIDALIDTLNPDFIEQAIELIKTLGGDPSYVEERVGYKTFKQIADMGARHREELSKAEAELPKDALRGHSLDKSTEEALRRYSDMQRQFAIERTHAMHPYQGNPEKAKAAEEYYDGVRSFDQ